MKDTIEDIMFYVKLIIKLILLAWIAIIIAGLAVAPFIWFITTFK